MAPAPPSSWSTLNIQVLVLIVAKLACLADRATFAFVCWGWAKAAKRAKQTRPLPSQIPPWLLLSSPSPRPSIFSFLSGVKRGIRSFPAEFARERLCGSHPGGWVAAALGPFGQHLLANVYSGARIGLPHRLLHASYKTMTPVMVRNVVLSAAPTAAHCVVGAIVCGVCNIAFCRPGVDPHWFAHAEIALQDMVYYAGEAMQGFHVLTELGDLRAISFNITNVEGSPTSVVQSLTMGYKMEQVPDAVMPSLPNSTFRTGYLVVSREKLLMVMRYYSRGSQIGVRRTLLFRVFEMQMIKTSGSSRQPRASWVELDGLDGRVLFLGRGCSRAYEAAEIQGFSGGSIYYLDDAEFDVMLCLQNEAQYPCSDMGMYSMPGTTVRPSLDAPTPNRSPAIYGPKTYLSYSRVNENANDAEKANEKSFVEMTEEDAAQNSAGRKIIGTRWSILTEPQTKFSPPIWLCP